MDTFILWDTFYKNLEEKTNSFTFNTWLKELKLEDINNNDIKILCPNELTKIHLEKEYSKVFKDILRGLTNVDFNVILTDQQSYKKKPSLFKTNLNKEYNFLSYVTGESNKMVSQVALQIAENPGTLFNPLFVYGKSGLGKTHIMHAIGNYIQHKFIDKKILYVTSETFMNEFINALSSNTIYNFKELYRDIDVLLIDDIQFLEKKEKSITEFFHTFNYLFQEKKQIVISSDRTPNELKFFDDRVKTRFSQGIIVEVRPPEFSQRIAILKKKVIAHGLTYELTAPVIEFIAKNIQTDVRQLEGALNKLIAYATIFNIQTIDVETAKIALSDLFVQSENEITVQKIQQKVANFYKISLIDLKSKKRSVNIVLPRHIAIYLTRELLEWPYKKIAEAFNKKDHTTIIHSCKYIKSQLEDDSRMQEAIEKLKKELL